jgi:hypothetical protein
MAGMNFRKCSFTQETATVPNSIDRPSAGDRVSGAAFATPKQVPERLKNDDFRKDAVLNGAALHHFSQRP